MSNPEDSAFPVQRQLREDGEVLTYAEAGLNKREYFAARVMQGLCSSVAYDEQSFEETAALAVKQADALLASLSK